MTIEFRLLDPSEIGDAVKLWEACGLIRPWNDPAADALRALEGPSSTIMASCRAGSKATPSVLICMTSLFSSSRSKLFLVNSTPLSSASTEGF